MFTDSEPIPPVNYFEIRGYSVTWAMPADFIRVNKAVFSFIITDLKTIIASMWGIVCFLS
jgi:hypothetical protein